MPNDAERRNLYPERMNECSILNTKLHSLLNQTSTRHLVCSVLYRIEEKIYRPEKKILFVFVMFVANFKKSPLARHYYRQIVNIFK